MKSITITEFLTALVALYGAVLSTVIFFRSRKKDLRRVKIELTTGVLTGLPQAGELMLIFSVSNPGFKDVTVTGPQLQMPDGKNVFFPNIGSNVQFPYTLMEGKSFQAWYPLNQLRSDLINAGYSGKIKVTGVIYDQTNKLFKGTRLYGLVLGN